MSAEEYYERYQEPPGYKSELVDGEVVLMPGPGFPHGLVSAKLAYLLTQHALQHRLGMVVVESGYVLQRKPDTVRGPDVSFVSAARVDAEGVPRVYFEGSPDLAVEVLSPDDRAIYMEDKVAQYLAKGARLVWVINPQRRTATVHVPDGPPRVIGEDDALDGGDVVPGFACALREALDW
jgi:Uma2 family endonuclease